MTKAELEAAYELAQKAIEQKDAAIAALQATIDTMQAQLDGIEKAQTQGQKEKPEAPKPFEYEGKIYRFTSPSIILKGNKYRTASLSANAEILAEILAIKGQRILELVDADQTADQA